MFDFIFDHDHVIHVLGLDNSSPETQAQVLDGIYTQLENMMRARLAGLMTAEDHKIFAELADKDPDQAKSWLESRFPDHKRMYEEELEDLVTELKRHADVVVNVSNKKTND